MSASDNHIPRYRKHKASGQAVVTLSGQDFYLGPHGTKTSHTEYDREVAEWLARGRRPKSNAIESEGYTVVDTTHPKTIVTQHSHKSLLHLHLRVSIRWSSRAKPSP